jgi:hypothetical protein
VALGHRLERLAVDGEVVDVQAHPLDVVDGVDQVLDGRVGHHVVLGALDDQHRAVNLVGPRDRPVERHFRQHPRRTAVRPLRVVGDQRLVARLRARRGEHGALAGVARDGDVVGRPPGGRPEPVAQAPEQRPGQPSGALLAEPEPGRPEPVEKRHLHGEGLDVRLGGDGQRVAGAEGGAPQRHPVARAVQVAGAFDGRPVVGDVAGRVDDVAGALAAVEPPVVEQQRRDAGLGEPPGQRGQAPAPLRAEPVGHHHRRGVVRLVLDGGVQPRLAGVTVDVEVHTEPEPAHWRPDDGQGENCGPAVTIANGFCRWRRTDRSMSVPPFFLAIGFVLAAPAPVCLVLAWYTWTRADWTDVYPGDVVTERTAELQRVGTTVALLLLVVVPAVSLVSLYGILAQVRTGEDVAASTLPFAQAAVQFPSNVVRTAAFIVACAVLLGPVALAVRDWLVARRDGQVP